MSSRPFSKELRSSQPGLARAALLLGLVLAFLALAVAPQAAADQRPAEVAQGIEIAQDDAETDPGVDAAEAEDLGDAEEPDPDATSTNGKLEIRSDEGRIPVIGVEILVESPDGEFSQSAVTGDDGTWTIDLPEPGDYVGTINVESFPDGVTLLDEDRSTVEFTARPGRPQPIIFGVQGGDRNGGSRANDVKWIQLTVDGIKLGLIIGMMSIGLSLIFGTTGLVNFAHGEMVTLGAVLAYWFNRTGIFNTTFHLIIAAIAAVILCAVFGGLFDTFVWAPLRRRGASLISMLVVSIGISIFMRYTTQYQFGTTSRTYSDYAVQKAVDYGPFAVVPKDLYIMGLSLVILVGVGLLLQMTRIGKAMRAVADNRDLAESSGIDVERVIRLVWVFGAALAGLGGILNGITESVGWDTGFRLLLLVFASTTLGGLGTAYGALAGSLVVGVLIQLSTLISIGDPDDPIFEVTPDLKNLGPLVMMVFILLIRPQGLLGRAERVG